MSSIRRLCVSPGTAAWCDSGSRWIRWCGSSTSGASGERRSVIRSTLRRCHANIGSWSTRCRPAIRRPHSVRYGSTSSGGHRWTPTATWAGYPRRSMPTRGLRPLHPRVSGKVAGEPKRAAAARWVNGASARYGTCSSVGMAARHQSGAAKERALDELRGKAAHWRGCPLAEGATQIVFGVGPATARVMFIGEAPSKYEDEEGVPFVGPAGAIFNKALARAKLDRDEAYVTNVEKFKHSKKAGRNQPPKQSEINACRPWLLKEIAIVQPEIICCLGALAAKWVLGRDFKLMQQD